MTTRTRSNKKRERLVATAESATLRRFRVEMADGAYVFDIAIQLGPVESYAILLNDQFVGDGRFRLDGPWDRAAAEGLITAIVRGKYPDARIEFRGTQPRKARTRAA